MTGTWLTRGLVLAVALLAVRGPVAARADTSSAGGAAIVVDGSASAWGDFELTRTVTLPQDLIFGSAISMQTAGSYVGFEIQRLDEAEPRAGVLEVPAIR